MHYFSVNTSQESVWALTLGKKYIVVKLSFAFFVCVQEMMVSLATAESGLHVFTGL